MKDLFIKTLNSMGKRATNAALMSALKLEPEAYLELREELKAEGRIKMGRGRGGIVMSREET
jgi:hypothetical protein